MSDTIKKYDNPKFEKWLSKQPMRKGNGLSISDTTTNKDNQAKFLEWLDTCREVEFRTIVKMDEDGACWIYTVDFAVVKEDDDYAKKN